MRSRSKYESIDLLVRLGQTYWIKKLAFLLTHHQEIQALSARVVVQSDDVTRQIALAAEVRLTHARKAIHEERVQIVKVVQESGHVVRQ